MKTKILQFFLFVTLVVMAIQLPAPWIYAATTLTGPFIAGVFLTLLVRWFPSDQHTSLFYHVMVVTGLPGAGYVARNWKGPGGIRQVIDWCDENLWTALQPAAPTVIFVVCLIVPAALAYMGGILAGDAVFGPPPDAIPVASRDDTPPAKEEAFPVTQELKGPDKSAS